MPNVSVKIYYFGAFLLVFLSYVKKKQYLCGAFYRRTGTHELVRVERIWRETVRNPVIT